MAGVVIFAPQVANFEQDPAYLFYKCITVTWYSSIICWPPDKTLGFLSGGKPKGTRGRCRCRPSFVLSSSVIVGGDTAVLSS